MAPRSFGGHSGLSLNINILSSITTLHNSAITIIHTSSIKQNRPPSYYPPQSPPAATSFHYLRLLQLRHPLLNFFQNLGGLSSISPHAFKIPYDHHITLTCLTAPTTMLFRALALFLLLIVACVAAPTAPRVDTPDPEVVRQAFAKLHSTPGEPSGKSILKRWWSVPGEHETQPEDIRPWPPGEDGSRTITDCFEDQKSYGFLWTTSVEALVKWEPAMQVSTLAFAYDPACTRQPCLCSAPGVAEATLHIILGEAEQGAYGTFGCTDRIVENSEPNMPRHYPQCSHAPSLIWGTSATVIMGQELSKRLETGTSRYEETRIR